MRSVVLVANDLQHVTGCYNNFNARDTTTTSLVRIGQTNKIFFHGFIYYRL